MEVLPFSSIEELPHEARALLQKNVSRNVFVSETWLTLFEEHLVKKAENPLYLVALNGVQPVSVLPLMVAKNAIVGRWRISSLTNFYSCLYDGCFGDVELQSETVLPSLGREYAKFIASEIQAPLVEIAPLRGRAPFWEAMMEKLAESGMRVRRFPRSANWFEPVSGVAFKDYWKRRPGKLRNTVKRRQAQLAKSQKVRFHIAGRHSENESLDAAISDYEVVYQDSWKPTESNPEFLRKAICTLAAAGLARIGLLYLDDEPAAAQIWFRLGKDWSIFKLAYRNRFAELSVGSVLTAYMVETALSDGDVCNLDFLTGDDAYKKDWMSSRRMYWGFEAFNPRSLIGACALLKRNIVKVPAMNADEI